ncbi:MAG: ABC transporter ATP-binding protein [Bacteroidetes bacterium]|nr:ABC transporter ATP-binding protein [Bacteroidota bacterium]MBL7104443.1 ABC transporter ATP-binding protein [Bacteroidales bacterium]
MEIEITKLSKTYSNGVVALKNVSLNIPTGLYGLLGPNGAGKSTLMRIIATLQEADSGEIRLGDIDVLTQKREVKKILGYLPQEFGFYPKDNAYNLLDHFIMLKGVGNKKERREKVEMLLRRVNLWNERKQKLKTFSGGMKQRFGIAHALLGNPKLIIVDEPTAGLDPEERNRFHNLLSEIGEDIIIILSTHIVADVSQLCSNMAIINNGEILFKDNPANAINSLKGKIWEKDILKSDIENYEKKYDVISNRLFTGKTFIRIYSESNPGNNFESSPTTLEDVYFYWLSRNNR